MKLTFLSVVVILLLTGCPQAQVQQTASLHWDINHLRDISFHAVHEVGLQPDGTPEFIENNDISLSFDGKGNLTVKVGKNKFGPFSPLKGGYLQSSTATVPSYEIAFLMSILPINGVSVQKNDQWVSYFPLISEIILEDEVLSVQDQFTVKVDDIRQVGNDTLVDLTIKGKTRFIQNSAFKKYYNAMDSDEQLFAHKMISFIPNLNAKVTMNASRHQVDIAEIDVLLMPRTEMTHALITSSPHRRKIKISSY